METAKIKEELKISYRTHPKTNGEFIHYGVSDGIRYYVYSFGFHCTPSKVTITQWHKCMLCENLNIYNGISPTSMPLSCLHNKDDQEHECLLPFFGDNEYIENYIKQQPSCMIKDDFWCKTKES